MTILRKEKSSKIALLLKNRIVLLGLAVLAIILFLLIKSLFKSPSTIPTFIAKKGDLEISVTVSGELRAKKTVSIIAPVPRSGKLKIINLIPEGTYVEPGTVVVKFDPSDALLEVKKAESELELALSEKNKVEARHKSESVQLDSQLKGAELGYQLSKLRLEQIKFEAKIKQDEALLTNQLDELKYQETKQAYESKKIIQKSEMDKTDLEIRQKRDALVKAQEALRSLSLVSNAKGLVVYSLNYQNQGRKFSVGDDAWGTAPIIELPDLSAMESVTFVNEIDISKIKPGQQVVVRLDAFREQTFTGSVSFIAPLGESRRSNIRAFEVTIDMKNESTILKPGMTTSNKIIVNELKAVFFVPLDAVFDKEGKKYVYVQNGSHFKSRSVVLGEKSEDYVVVKEGLSEGESIALLDPFAKAENGLLTGASKDLDIPGDKK
ncbi:MAG: efflux RND transporter periplasmic adaptor subunit [Candidatus Aminicenantes bacterium]|nr:efflux RND transporter periplasmic adaptor subunit [Candidatus Aminicenantes bacterium]